jgi:hypothetical protein
LSTSLLFLNVNPSVLLKTKWDNVQLSIGIGALVKLSQSFQFSSNTSSGIYSAGFDSSDLEYKRNSRGVLPYVSFGAIWTIKQHLKLQGLITPTLLDFYDGRAKINYYVNQTKMEYPMNYKPLYFGLRLFYFSGSRS